MNDDTIKLDFPMESSVKILPLGSDRIPVGMVVGFWIDRHGFKKYLVEYVNKTDTFCSDWFEPKYLKAHKEGDPTN